MVFDSLYKHFNSNDQSNTVYNKGDPKTQTGLRKNSLGHGTGVGGDSQNLGGTGGASKTSKLDDDDLKTDKVKTQTGKVYDKYSKDN